MGSEAALEAGGLHSMSGDPREQNIGGEVGVGGLHCCTAADMQTCRHADEQTLGTAGVWVPGCLAT